jgi:PilZ domain
MERLLYPSGGSHPSNWPFRPIDSCSNIGHMSDPVSTAKTAREHLARGLNALQSDPNVPPKLLELAAPIAQSMGALHHIERSQGRELSPHADLALNNVRLALQSLQGAGTQHPAVNQAMEAVAASLGLVHALSKMAVGGGAPQQAQQQQRPQQQQQMPPQNAFPVPQQQMPPQQMQPQQRPPQQQQMPPQQMQPQQRQMPAQAVPQGGMVAGDPFARPAGPQASPSMPVPAPPMQGNMPVVSADLGAHSSTNFYKGLSGNDIVDHGGLFVSTYMIPKIGTPVRLKVALPGGYEFEANAIVKWSREQSDGGADAPPGFGAQFTQITPEARQLVYRYVRNREPLFHDDL